MRMQAFHTQICKYLIMTAQYIGCGGNIGLGEGACVVSIVSIHLDLCNIWMELQNIFLDLGGVRSD